MSVHFVKVVEVLVVDYPEYGGECSVEHFHLGELSELAAHLVVQPVQVKPPERQAVLSVGQDCPLPVGLQSLDSGKMSEVTPASCGRRLRYQWVGLLGALVTLSIGSQLIPTVAHL